MQVRAYVWAAALVGGHELLNRVKQSSKQGDGFFL